MQHFWLGDGNWYKGNLHTHTTQSDGAATPDDMMACYRKAGYDFLALSDHNRLTRVTAAPAGLLLIPGEEVSAGIAEMGGEFHFVAVNLREQINPREFGTPQAIIDAVRAQGGEVVIAHPFWSALTIRDLLPLRDYLGIEIYNSSCFYSIGKGHSLVQWDDLLIRGCRVLGFAHDDAHYHFNDHRPNDAAVAYIMVKATALTVDGIMAALRAGEFYACSGPGTGPEIKDFYLEDGYAVARTSPSAVITIATESGRGLGESFTASAGATITDARYKLRGREKFVRLEVTDRDGKAAWSNPLFTA
ncbi:MAG: hypothetical protein A3K19_13605 [Lentisphaerae bacterium RIFOXYB12_FULL_65_16]|nr:MAG: hypothetical protein A3K18_05405 [Lentisphaerae bacterium RIFOXYA12_64_32]OGV93072.1 MAG: hypothetical protein A3K19_13605 [Lentisphaerae bacterium RIFOXYB12_FULL_65_16]